MIWCTSSTTPGTVWCSCTTPSILKAHTAAPRSDESSTRRMLFPSVWPKPRSSGASTNCAIRPSSERDSTSMRCGSTNPVRSSSTVYLPGLSPVRCVRPSFVSIRLRLLRVQLDDELLLDRERDLRARGPLQHAARPRPLIQCEPPHHLGPGLRFQRRLNGQQIPRGLPYPDLVAGLDRVTRDVHYPPVHLDVPVPNELTRLTPARREREPVHDVVQPALQRNQEVLARHAGLLRRPLEQVLEVPLAYAVDPLDLLLLTQLLRVIRHLPPARLRQTMLTRRIVPTLDRTLLRVAARALQEQLLAFTTAKPADRPSVTTHGMSDSPVLSVVCPASSRPNGLAVYTFTIGSDQNSRRAHPSSRRKRPRRGSPRPSAEPLSIQPTSTTRRFRAPHRNRRTRQIPQTRRFFGARQPLCGIGVTSRIERICNPAAANAWIADSRPLPGPCTRT